MDGVAGKGSRGWAEGLWRWLGVARREHSRVLSSCILGRWQGHRQPWECWLGWATLGAGLGGWVSLELAGMIERESRGRSR